MSKLIDETGNTYGKLTVIAKDPELNLQGAQWVCQCICGKTVSHNGRRLRKGFVTSCGCNWRDRVAKNAIDEIGNEYGLLTVLEFSDKEICDKIHWLCECKCGIQAIVSGADLRSGNTTSCGCLQTESRYSATRKYSPEDTTWMCMYASHVKSQDRHGYLPYELWRDIVARDCYYCGAAPEIHTRPSGTPVFANGIDRYDNTLGYELSNCVPCCKWDNYRKGSTHGDDYIAGCLRVADHIRKRKED
jgi:hypothetical protein